MAQKTPPICFELFDALRRNWGCPNTQAPSPIIWVFIFGLFFEKSQKFWWRGIDTLGPQLLSIEHLAKPLGTGSNVFQIVHSEVLKNARKNQRPEGVRYFGTVTWMMQDIYRSFSLVFACIVSAERHGKKCKFPELRTQHTTLFVPGFFYD